MNATLYSNDILSPQIAGIKSFVDAQFDHSWLIHGFHPQVFNEMDMQELRTELANVVSYGTSPGHIRYILEKLKKLHKALVQLSASELRHQLRMRGEKTVQKELILSTLEANAARLNTAIEGIQAQL